MRCYNFCPTASVLINARFTDPPKYFRYRGPDNHKIGVLISPCKYKVALPAMRTLSF